MRSLPWGDLLTAYNGSAITYDEIGNPLSDGASTYTWEHGRQLATQTKNGVTWTYTYDANGMRTSRTSDTKSYSYVYSGNKLVQMTITDHTTTPETVQLLEFTYDAAGQPLMLTLDGTRYYYVLNIQGDVTGLVDEAGNIQILYYYEGYGEGRYLGDTSDMTPTLVAANPLAYRGYVMDIGTAQYYLQSRYYNPNVGRFINGDAFASTGQGLIGNNMFAYCGNNPIMRCDSNGTDWVECIRTVLHGGNNLLVAIGIDTAKIGAFFLQMEADSYGIYHAEFDCWQQYFGYCDLYDIVFDTFTSMVAKEFPFTYNGKGYTIWAWKGNYINLGAGAELGIYHKSDGFRIAGTDIAMWMGMVLTYNGKTIVNHFPGADQWWITSFNSQYLNVDANNLSVTFGLRFNDSRMYKAFKRKYGGDSHWKFDDSILYARLQF